MALVHVVNQFQTEESEYRYYKSKIWSSHGRGEINSA